MEVHSKILVVDDRPENLIALEKLIREFDVEILKAHSGNEALTLTLTNEFALALIDVQMPDMDGYETVRLMRNVERTKYLPVIFLSAIYSEDHYKILGIEAGAVDFIPKPIHPKILQGKVKVFLDLYKQRKLLEIEIEQRKIIESELREAERQISFAKEKAEEADRLKTAFLANMSHEIRTPLNAIVGFSNLLGDTELESSKRLMYLSYINNSSEALTALIGDIIDTAKIEAGQLEIIPSPVNIPSMFHELFESTKINMARTGKKDIRLKLSMPDNVDSYTLFLDGIRFRQVFQNLLINASKFTKSGEIEFGFHFKESNIPEFYVRDTGIGITQKQQKYIFEMFRQVPQEDNANYSGTGLGLSIVKRILELMGGDIALESEFGKGSTFLFTVAAEERNSTTKEVKKLPEKSKAPEKQGSIKILIAEDEIINYQLLKEILPKDSSVEWAQTGQEAIELIKKNTEIDIILMDLKMPVKTGYQALKEIRKLNPDIPVIAQTAYAMDGEKDAILDFGFDGYIPKPIKIPDLLNLIARLVKK